MGSLGDTYVRKMKKIQIEPRGEITDQVPPNILINSRGYRFNPAPEENKVTQAYHMNVYEPSSPEQGSRTREGLLDPRNLGYRLKRRFWQSVFSRRVDDRC